MFKKAVLKLIGFYRLWPHQQHCRFYPSCSAYGHRAIARYGIVKGSFLALKRILRCHPWSKGGIDNVV